MCPFLDLPDLVLCKILLLLFELRVSKATPTVFHVSRIIEPRVCFTATCKQLYALMPHADIRAVIAPQVRELRAKFFQNVVDVGMHAMNHGNCLDLDGDCWTNTFELQMGTMQISVLTMFRSRLDYFVYLYVSGERDDQPTCQLLRLFAVPALIELPPAERTEQQVAEVAQWTATHSPTFVQHLLDTFQTIEFRNASRDSYCLVQS